jgi:hypothetical protein
VPATVYMSIEHARIFSAILAESLEQWDALAVPKKRDTTVPPIRAPFEDAVRALLKTPPPPKNLGRPKVKKKAAKKR